MRKEYGVILAVIGLIFICYVEGWGTDWKHYYSDNESDLYYDAESMIHQKDGSVKVWIKAVRKRETKSVDEAWDKSPQFLTNNITKEFLRLIEINCPNRTFRNLAFGERDKDGKPISGVTQREIIDTTKDYHIQPDSSMDRFHKVICK